MSQSRDEVSSPQVTIAEKNPGGPSSIPLELSTARGEARKIAEARLRDSGFVFNPAQRIWIGGIELDSGLYVKTRVELATDFPDTMPRVFIDHKSLPRRVAHVERSDKVCIVPSNGILIDADKPAQLIDEALSRARRVIAEGLAGQSDNDIQAEFIAYWEPESGTPIWNTCDVRGPSRLVALGELLGQGDSATSRLMAAESHEAARIWAHKAGFEYVPTAFAFFARLKGTFDPPLFDAEVTQEDARRIILQLLDEPDAQQFQEFILESSPPTYLLCSLPEAEQGAGRRLIALSLERPRGKGLKRVQRGFRPGHVPRSHQVYLQRRDPIRKLKIDRLDRDYIAPRGGASSELSDALVVVVGVGAVGSEVAVDLALAGVQNLRLVDADVVRPENLHRHALGVRHMFKNKAAALRNELESRLPNLAIEVREKRVEVVLEEDPQFLTDAAVVLLATGDPTVERRLNRTLHGTCSMIHVWLEPLSVAGHVLVCGTRKIGCFECLYKPDPEFGLINKAALVAPGQEVARTLAGCAGTFSPFSALDSRRTAIEAASETIRWLTVDNQNNRLITWRGDESLFLQSGHRLSARAARVPANSHIQIPSIEFANSECPVCGS